MQSHAKHAGNYRTSAQLVVCQQKQMSKIVQIYMEWTMK